MYIFYDESGIVKTELEYFKILNLFLQYSQNKMRRFLELVNVCYSVWGFFWCLDGIS